MGDIVAWFLDPANLSGPASIPQRLFEHIVLCAAALVTATAIALPIGLYVGHTRRFAGLAINAANIGRALPSYALVVMILPVSGRKPFAGSSVVIRHCSAAPRISIDSCRRPMSSSV